MEWVVKLEARSGWGEAEHRRRLISRPAFFHSPLAYADVSDGQKGGASTLWSVAQQSTIGMGIAFAIAGLLTLLSGIFYLRLARDAGAGISQRRVKPI